MYLKLIKKNGKLYHILCVCDNSTNVWVSHFINEDVFVSLRDCGIKVKNIGGKR